MKPKYFNNRRNLFGTAVGCASIIVTFSSVRAASIYWDGATTAGWDAVANWSTVDGATTPDPAAVPGASDEAIFNTTGVNGNETVNLNANQLASKLTFSNTGTTLLQGGGTNRTLGIGAGGISMASGAGAVSIGSAVTNQNVTTTLTASQTWANNSANPVTFAQNFTTSAGVNITKTGTGNVAMSNTANGTTIAGLLDVQAGKVQTAGDLTINGGLSGAGTLENGGSASKWIFVASPTDVSFGGTIQGNPANAANVRLGLVKRGIGMMTLTGTNTVADNFNVENGTVRLTGTHNVGYAGGGQASVGSVANQNGILIVDGATINATKNANPSFAIGTAANSRGVVKMNTGTLNSAFQLNIGNGNGTGAYAALSMSGGVLNVANWLVVGAQNDRAILNQTGGSIVETANRMTIGAGGNGSIGVSNHSGGSLTIAAGGNTGIFLGENGTGTLNLSGTAAIDLQTNGGATSGTLVFGNNGSSLAGTLNLNGGTLTTKEFVKGASTAGAVYRINFNGTTIKPNAANAGFLNDLANTLGYVNPNGAIFDTNNFNTSVNMPLRAPTGSGISAIAVTAGGTGYLDTPLVTITGGTGTGAQALAVVSPYVMTDGVVTSGGALTGFIITNPGVGYTPGDVLTVSLAGGGASVAATPGAVTLAANASGGLTKTGNGILSIGGVNTYTGATNVTGGALATVFSGDINSSSAVNVNGTGASFVQDSSVNLTAPVTVTNGTLDGTGTLSTVNMANSAAAILTHGDGTGGPITIGALNFNDAATVNLNVTSTSAEIVATTLNTGAVGGGKVTINASNVTWPPGLHDLITYTGAIGGGGFSEIQKGTISGLSARQTATLTNPSGKIALNITGDNPVWTGAVNGNWTTNVIANPKNWNLVSNSSSHTDFITGDIVLFDDNATTTTVNISSANVSPISSTFNNFGSDYAINSSGGFGIATGSVILNGGASVALSTANTYPGGTFLNFGTLRINNASAIGTGPLTLASGVSIDNTSAAAITLSTVNAQNWNGDFTFLGSDNLNLGTGAVTLNDNRTVTTMGTTTLGVGGAIGGAGFALNKAGTGTLALSGASTYTGQTNVNGGTVLLTGSINAANAANVGQVSVGTASDNAILRITGGTLNASSTAVPGVAAGKYSGGSGAIIVDSGSLTAFSELQLGTVGGGNGSMIINGGNVSYGNWVSVGRDGNGVMDVNGGTLTVSTQNVTQGSFATGYGVVNLNGGTTNVTNVTAGQGNYYVGEGGTGVLTVSGGAALNVAGALGVRLALNGATSFGVVNLNGGTTTTPAVTKGAGTGIFNFNGGTLKATAANAAFMTGLTNAYIYGGGATINNNGTAISIDQPLLAPTGSGLSASGLIVAGSGFITPPQIRISGGGGIGATAVANLDVNGNLTGITFTSPGIGYTSDPLIDVVGGGGSGTVTGSPVLVANTGGGLIANGAGTLGLTGASTYPGTTTVAAGTLALTGTGSVNSSSGITVNGSGAKFLQISTTAVTSPVTITSGSLDGVGSLSGVSVASAAGNAVSNGNGGTGVLTVGSLAFTDAATVNVKVSSTSPGITTTTLNSGAGGGGKVTVNASKTSWSNGTVYNLISYTSLAGGGFAEFSKGTITGLTSRQTATLTNPAGNVALSIVGDTPVWTGAFNGSWTTAAITSPKNWKLLTGGTPTDFVTLDTALFDDSATGTTAVDIGENVTPTSAIFNNTAAKSYTLASVGGFGIVGSGFLTVNGIGSVAIGNANTYSGGTFLNAGTLGINNASAIGTGMLTLAGGTLDSNGAADTTLTTNNPTTLTSDFTFAGTKNLSLGNGSVTLAGSGTVRTVNVANNRLSIGGIPVANGYGISKAGPGTLAINGTGVSAISGDLDVTAGTFEIGAQSFTATGLSGTGAVVNGSAVDSPLIVNNTVAKTFPGSLQNGAGVGQLGLTKQGTGNLTLTGSSTLGSEVRVEGGVLTINGGTLNATKTTSPSLSVAPAASARGVLRMSSGLLTTVTELHIGNGNGAAGTLPYAAMSLSGGTVTSGNWLVVALNNDRAILNQTGGSITVTANRMTIGAGGNNAFGVVNLSGGSFNNSVGIFLGENGNGTLNISGSASPSMGNMQFGGNGTSLGGTLNLLGGTLNTGSVTQGASTAGAVYLWNFNGGTLKATGNSATYFADLANTTAYVNSGGAIVDDNGFAITIGEPLLAPTGSGVNTITVTSGGSGYLDTPFVSITGGSGSGASAVANVTGGVVTGFTITNPGVGYVPGDVLTATVFGGGATVEATVGSVNLAANNTTGGLIKNGGGTVTLTGLNTYSGDTVVNNGLLSITNNGTLADAAAVRLASTGTLNLTYGGTDTVDKFFLNNVQQASGEWGAIGSGAAHTTAQITGTGRILVTTGNSDPYTTWADSFPGLTDKTPGADFDKDGFTNLMEFILGGNPTIASQSIAPTQVLTPTTLVFSFKRSDESEAPTTVQTVETSTNLSNWASSVIAPITIGAGNSSGTGYTVTVSENGTSPDDVTVTINRGANTAMFARLRANKP